MNNCWPGTVEWSSQKTCNQSVPKARWSSAGQTHKGSKEIGTCQSSLPCRASTACLPTGKMEQNRDFVRQGRLKTDKFLMSPENIWKYSRLLQGVSFGPTWLMLSVVWTSCWARTNAPCSLHNLCNAWREALGHLLLPSSSFDTRSSAERLLFPADLVFQIVTITFYSTTMCFSREPKTNPSHNL